ncbi:MAG: TIM barrel protein, partial [Rhodomicrobium sp.]
DCAQVNCLAGIPPAGLEPRVARRTLAENLKFAASKLQDAGISLLAEPVNTYDIPGFFLNRSAQAISLFDEVGSPNLKLQYDIYHMQRMEGELANTIERLLPRIAHLQLADNPGRNEPGTGEINYPFLLNFIDRLGYDGWIGCEYKPRHGTKEGLGWMQAYR